MAKVSGEERMAGFQELDRRELDWQDLVERHGPAAWRIAYRLLGNRADADECLQETFLTALDVSRRESVDNWQALIVRLAASRAIDRLRSRDRRRQREQNAVSWTRRPQTAPPDQNLVEQELAGQLRVALAELPVRQAEVFCLHCLDEWSYQQIAHELAISVDAVGVLLHRARLRLRNLLAALAPGSGHLRRETGRTSAETVYREESQ